MKKKIIEFATCKPFVVFGSLIIHFCLLTSPVNSQAPYVITCNLSPDICTFIPAAELTVTPAGASLYEFYAYIEFTGSFQLVQSGPNNVLIIDYWSTPYYCRVTDGGGVTQTNIIQMRCIFPAFWTINSTATSSSVCGGATLTMVPAVWDSYQWYKNGVQIQGATAATYYATQPGNYNCFVTNSCGGDSAYDGSLIYQVINNPSPVVTANGATTFCLGNNVLLSTPSTTGATYQWKKNNVVIGGATLNTYVANATGIYKVVKTNAAGCTGTSAVKHVTVNGLPTATATAQGPVSFCAGDSVVIKANYNSSFSYQWKKNNSNISGATLKNYTAKSGGNYKVKVTNANGCTKLSNIVTVSVPCREGENESRVSDFNAAVYPNPSSGDFIFEIQSEDNSKTCINIYDVMGKLVLSEITYGHESVINASGLNPGVYTAILSYKENNKILRLVKTK